MGSFPETYILKHPNNFVWTDALEERHIFVSFPNKGIDDFTTGRSF